MVLLAFGDSGEDAQPSSVKLEAGVEDDKQKEPLDQLRSLVDKLSELDLDDIPTARLRTS